VFAACCCLCVWTKSGQFYFWQCLLFVSRFLFLSPGAAVHLGLPLRFFIPLWHRVTPFIGEFLLRRLIVLCLSFPARRCLRGGSEFHGLRARCHFGRLRSSRQVWPSFFCCASPVRAGCCLIQFRFAGASLCSRFSSVPQYACGSLVPRL
jgi:hypothetical protein